MILKKYSFYFVLYFTNFRYLYKVARVLNDLQFRISKYGHYFSLNRFLFYQVISLAPRGSWQWKH